MASFVVYNSLSQKEAKEVFKGLEQWFEANPKRKTCMTDLGKIRKSHLKEDLLRFCEKGVKL